MPLLLATLKHLRPRRVAHCAKRSLSLSHRTLRNKWDVCTQFAKGEALWRVAKGEAFARDFVDCRTSDRYLPVGVAAEF